MKKIVVSMAVVAVAVAAAACSSGKKAASKTVASGSYNLTNIAAGATDTCTIGAGYVAASGNFGTGSPAIDVIVDNPATKISSDFGFFVSAADCTLTGLACDTGLLQASPIDYTNKATEPRALTGIYQCTDQQTFEVTGTITGHNAFTYQISMQIAKTAGTDADCVLAENSEFGLSIANGFTFPCNSTMGANAKM